MKLLWIILIELLAFAILTAPFTWEQANDKLGDKNKGADVVVRGLLMLLSSFLNYVLRDFGFTHFGNLWQVLTGIARPFLQSFALFFMFFDYIIAYRLGHKQALNAEGTGWLEYLGQGDKVMEEKTKVKYNWFDRQHWWSKLGWKGRLAVKLVVFIGATIFYFSKFFY